MRYGFKCYAMRHDEIGAYENISTIGGNLCYLPYDKEGILPEIFAKHNACNTNSLLYINPVNHYPTGITMSRERRDKLFAICKKYRMPIIENDILRDLWVNEPPAPMKSEDENDQIVYIGSFSTSFQANARFAWVVAPSAIVDRIGEVKCQVYSINNRILDMYANSYLKGGYYDKSMHKIRSKLPERISKIDSILRKHLTNIAVWDTSCLNYFIWLKFISGINTDKIYNNCSKMIIMSGMKYNSSSHLVLNSVCESIDRTNSAVEYLAFLVSNQINGK